MGLISSRSFASLLLCIAVQSVKKYFMIPTPKKFESGRIRTHDVGTGQFLRDITRNSPLTKYPKFDGDTANHRGATVRWVRHGSYVYDTFYGKTLKASVRFELPTFEYVPDGPDFAGRWFLPTCAKTTALTA